MISHIEGFGTMAAVNSTADPPAEPIPSGKFMKIKKKYTQKAKFANSTFMNFCMIRSFAPGSGSQSHGSLQSAPGRKCYLYTQI
jgi:hypothetical protein